jgi:predicted permease
MRLSDIAFRLRALFARRSLESQVDEEFAFHLRMEANRLEGAGWTPDEARAEARRRFGNETRERERARDAWGVGLGYDLIADVRHALRQLRRRPGFTAVAMTTMGLGIGATLALGSVVHGLLVRPLPFENADRLHVFWSDYNWRGSEYDHVREGSLAFDHIAAFSNNAEAFRTGPEGQARMLEYIPATANLFDALGARPLLGRGFLPGEDRPGAEPVVVVSHGFWQQELGGAPDVIGRRLVISGAPVTIVGVMPPGFHFPSPEFRAWRPLNLDPADPAYAGNGWLTLIGAAKSGATPAVMVQELQRLTRLLGERFTYPVAWDKTKDAHVTPVREYLMGSVREPLLLLLAAVTLLLLIACANAAALVLARTTDRSAELAIRVALGAGKRRIARQIATESITLASLAALAGAAVATAGFRALVGSLPVGEALGNTLKPGWQSFAMAFVMALVVGLAVAVVPVRQVLRGRLDVRERSEEGLRRGTQRVHATLIAGQVALAVVLVAGASLLIRSVERIRSLDTGFDPAGIVTLDMIRRTDGRDSNSQFLRDVLDRVSALPGVRSAGLTNRLPVRDGGWQGPVTIEGRADLAGPQRPNSLVRTATPALHATLGIAVREGRGFEESDRAGGLLVAMVSESFARRIWPGESAIGKRIRGTTDASWRTIVGVAEETRMTSMLGDIPFTLWVPHTQLDAAWAGAILVIKGDGADEASLVGAARRVIAELDDDVAVSRAGSMSTVIDAALAEPLRLRFFLTLFAGLALLLGSVGVFGVVSYAVARRRAEFGIRMALGAAPARVLTDVIRTGMGPVVLGATIGVAASLALSGVLRRFLFDVSPTDPASLAVAAAALLGAGALAAMVPGYRARGVSPVEALRSE